MHLTPRKMEILTAIHLGHQGRGYAPTLRELAAQLGIKPVTVLEHVRDLAAEGLVVRTPWRARSMELTDQGRAVLRGMGHSDYHRGIEDALKAIAELGGAELARRVQAKVMGAA